MAISKVILNGETQMDVTQDTVESEVLVTDYTATGADGVRLTGSFTPSSGTVTSVATGTGLTGGTITTSGTIKANLVSETNLSNAASAATEVSGRVYPVAVDANGKLAVNVPWENTTYTPASANPSMDGTAAVGTSTKYAREDHVHPSDTSRVPTSRTVNGHALSSNVTITASDVSAIPTSQKGAASGVAELDSNGKVPSSQLPSYVDDVLEYTNKSSFPTTGETGKIYVDKATNLTYRWSGTAYVEISPSLALGTTSSTAYRGDYGNTAYSHATDSSRLTTAKTSGLYKIAVTSEGHVASATAVQKSDITGLGIPESDTNTTYTFANGTNGFTVTPSGGSAQTVTVTPSISNNVTGSGTSGYIAKFNGANTITDGPALGSDTSKFLRNDGTWAAVSGASGGTVTSVATGAGLTGGPVTGSGTIKADLVSETKLSNAASAATEVSGRVYPVALDKNGDLAVNVPWTNTTYSAQTTSIGSASAGTAISADDITAWSAGSVPTLGDEIPADDITAWSAGTMFSASASEGVVTFTSGTAPSLSYTAKSIPNVTSVGSAPSLSYTSRSIPNISVTSTTVATGITAN